MHTHRYTHSLLPTRKSSAGLLIITANNNWFWTLQHAPGCLPLALKSTCGAQAGSCPDQHRCPRGIPFAPTPTSSSLRQQSISSNISIGQYRFLLLLLTQAMTWGGGWLLSMGIFQDGSAVLDNCFPEAFLWILISKTSFLEGQEQAVEVFSIPNVLLVVPVYSTPGIPKTNPAWPLARLECLFVHKDT